MTINLAGTAIKDVRVAGAQAQRVMLGTGTSAVEVWSASLYPLEGTFEIVNGAALTAHEVFSHTVVEPGNFTGTVTPTSGEVTVYNWTVNGSGVTGANGTTHTFTGLSVGDTIKVEVMHTATMSLSGTWSIVKTLPVVTITGTSGLQSRDQFRQACIDHGTTYQAVQVLPFLLDISQATTMSSMFNGCSSLTQVPDLDTANVTTMAYMFFSCSSLTQVPDLDTGNVTSMESMFRDCSKLTTVPDLDTANVTNMNSMFRTCSSLTDGNVRLIGKHPSVTTTTMISGSGLTREPFYDTNGNPI